MSSAPRTQARYPAPIEVRLARRTLIDSVTGCHNWTGHLKDGYGIILVGRVGDKYKKSPVHRVAYELARGPIPAGLVIDHLCRNHSCINPDHLEPVTTAENTRRGYSPAVFNAMKTHCPKGHSYSGDNLYILRGNRFCRACNRVAARRYAQRKKAEAGGEL